MGDLRCDGPPDYLRSWTNGKPYLYRAVPATAESEAAAASETVVAGAGGEECGFVILINGRDTTDGPTWRWTWTWPWHFLKHELEYQGRLSKVLVITPQPSNLSGSFYKQVEEVANIISSTISLNTVPVAAGATQEGRPLLQASGMLSGCKKIQVFLQAACHGSIVARAILARDGRLWKGQGQEAQAAKAAAARARSLLSSPLFGLSSVTLVVPALAGVRSRLRFGSTRRETEEAAAPPSRDESLETVLTWGGGTGPIYVHRDDSRLLCSLAASETQATSGSRSGSMLMDFDQISLFATIDGDIFVSPRSASGVSDSFQGSAGASTLVREAIKAQVTAAADAAAGKPVIAPAAADTPIAYKPHRLPTEFSPLLRLAMMDPQPEEVRNLLLNPNVCREITDPQRGHKTYERTLQLLQLWDWQGQGQMFHQLQQMERGGVERLRGTHSAFGLRRRHHHPGHHGLPHLLKFVFYIPTVPLRNDFSNSAHFLAFASRSWMLPAAAPLLRAVAAAAAGNRSRLELLTVMDTDSRWWED